MRCLLSTVVVCAACATGDDAVEPVDPDLPDQVTTTEAEGQIQFVPEGAPSPDRTACQANGPCDPGCDQALINELFVPPGACIVYTCQRDGETWLTGGCR